MRVVFWFVSAALIAIVTHLSYVLFVPALNFNQRIDAALKTQGENQFTVLDGELQARLIPFVSASDLVMLCKYDISKGPVRLAMTVPQGYWTLSVYTIHGRQAYALNDRQADARSFSVKLTRAKSFLEQLTNVGGDENEASLEDLGWRVDLAEDRGLAFLWMPLTDKWRRAEDLSEVTKSTCSRVDE